MRINPPRSPVPHLLSSNAIPNEEERKLIREAIVEAEARISQIIGDGEARGFEQRTLSTLKDFVCTHRALLSSIRYLPPELLQEVFLLYSETSTGYHRWIKPPFILGQICRSWRKVAISLPALWDRLPAFKLAASWTRGLAYSAFVRELLSRSGNSTTLKVYIRAPFAEIHKGHPVIDVLTQDANRIQTLTIESGVATFRLFSPMKEQLKNLEQLKLAFWTKQTFDPSDGKGLVDAFSSVPRLKSVCIMGRCPPNLFIPWPDIEEYMERYDGGRVSEVLQHSKGNLTTLEVVKNIHHPAPMIPPTKLERLRTLRVRLDDPSESASRFLSNLTLPAVESVHVVCGGHVVRILSEMLSHSSFTRSLRKLAFRGTITHTITELETLFSHIPQLSELDMEITDGDYAFLHIFENVSRQSPILPLLEKLSIHTISTTGTEELLNGIARVRCECANTETMPSSISTLSDPADMDFDLIQEIRPLKMFRINLPSRELRLTSQAALNNWTIPTRAKQYRDTAKLRMWGAELVDCFPWYFADPEPGLCLGDQKTTKHLEKGKMPKFPQRWDSILTEIEAFNTDGFDSVSLRVSSSSFLPLFYGYSERLTPNVNICTQASKLHYILLDIARAPVMYTLNERNFSYVQRARTLLNNWRAVLDCLSEYRWVLTGSSSLFYVISESREFDRWTMVNTLTDTFYSNTLP